MRFKKYLRESSNKDILQKKLDQWKNDLKRMTKLYRSLKADDTPQSIKKFKEARKHWAIFGNNWEKWYSSQLIKSSTDKDESYYQEQVRIAAWKAHMATSSLFPDEYDHKIGKHTSAPWRLDNPRYRGDSRKNKILVYQKAFKKAFDAIQDLIDYEAENVNITKDTEQHSIAGINVLVSGIKQKEDEKHTKIIKKFIQLLPKAVDKIKKEGFKQTLRGLTMELTLGGAKSVGVQSGAGGSYNYSTDLLRMYPMGMGLLSNDYDTLRTLIHELGHRYYYRHLSDKVQNAWHRAINKKSVEVKDKHIDEFMDKYAAKEDEFWSSKKKKVIKDIKDNVKDPFKRAIFLYLVEHYPRWFVKSKEGGEDASYEETMKNYRSRLKEFHSGEWLHLEFISDYATKNPGEAFAEAFSYWVMNKKRLGEWTRAFFKDVVRSGGANITEDKLLKYLDLIRLDK